MNTETPPTHDELVEKLEAWGSYIQELIDMTGGMGNPEKNSHDAYIWAEILKDDDDRLSLLRATIAELKRGQEDARRLDWLEKQRDFEGFTNLSGGFSLITSDAFKGESLREAIDSAISSTAKEEA